GPGSGAPPSFLGGRDPGGWRGARVRRPRRERRPQRSRGVHRRRRGRGCPAPDLFRRRRPPPGARGGRLPGRHRAVARRGARRRGAPERELAERFLAALGPDEWLVVDGVLSDSAALSAHPRALGVIKSHGAQYFEGAELERALTLPAGHRTSVFQPRSRGARRAIYSWYLRLWPWEGNDLLYGLLRVEAHADAATVARASALSAWLMRERSPLST